MKFNKDQVLSVVAPVYNESEGIKHFIAETVKVLSEMELNYEILLVNDGSKDNSLQVMQAIAKANKNIRIIELSRNYGREIAMTAGLESSVGDYVVVLDSDMQDPPKLIPKLLEKLLSDNLDIVYAARTSRRGESFIKKLSSVAFYRIAGKMTGLDIPDNAGDFRIFSRSVINAVTSMKEHNRYLKMLYAYVGFRVGHVPFDRQERLAGETSYNWKSLIGAAMDAIFAFSNKPLRAMSFLSIGISLLLFVYASYIFIEKLLGADTVEGWSSLMFMIALLFSIMFIFLALISEYIARILVESKNRPLYYIREEIGGTEFDISEMVQKESEKM
ncbi:MAG: glycosyltransferase family 2 protein [Hyphomicrobiales bacterium]